jgi:hypothetical protein
MDNYGVVMLPIFLLIVTGCSMASLTKTTRNEYDEQGRIIKSTITESKEGWLSNKMVGIKDDGFTVSFTTALDPATGMIMPTIKTSSGSTSVVTVPAIPFNELTDSTTITGQVDSFCNNTESFYFEKSVWSDKAAKIKYERLGSGYNLPPPSVRINMLSIVDGEHAPTNTPSIPEPPKPPAIPGAQ